MASIQQRRTADGKLHYRVQVRMRGYKPETETFERLTDAREWAQSTEADMRAGRHKPANEAKRHTLSELITKYEEETLSGKRLSTQRAQLQQLEWWRNEIGHLRLLDVTPEVISAKKKQLLRENTPKGTIRAPSTVIRYLAALAHVFTMAVKEWRWTASNPFEAVSKPKEAPGRVRFLNPNERKALLDACAKSRNRDLYDIVVLALSSGMRWGEIMYLTWDRVFLDKNMVLLTDTKNGQPRSLPLVGHALERIQDRARLRRLDTNLVFPARFRRGVSPKPCSMRNAFEKAVARAGLENFHFHDLRHCAASALLESGASLGEIAEVLGHKTLQMVKRYSHLSTAHTATIVEKMNRAIFTVPPNTGEAAGGRETHF